MTNWLDEILERHDPIMPPSGFSERVVLCVNKPKRLLLRRYPLPLVASLLILLLALWWPSGKFSSSTGASFEISAVSEIDAIYLSHEFLVEVEDPLIFDALVLGAPEEILFLLASIEN